MMAARVLLVETTAADLSRRMGSAARDWVVDRRLGASDRVVAQVGFAAEAATVEAMRRAAEGVLDPGAVRVRRWLDERAAPGGDLARAADLHADFVAWCGAHGLPSLGVAAFARRLHQLGIEGVLHSRTRRSQFRLGLR